MSFTTTASQTASYSSIAAIPAVSVSGTVGISGFGSFVCAGDGISQTFTSAAGGTVDLPGLHAGTGTVTRTLSSVSGLHATASLSLTLAPPVTAAAPPPPAVLRVTGVRLIHPTVVWCAGACRYPDSFMVFHLSAKARVRLQLREHTRRGCRTVATAFATGRKGRNRRRVAGQVLVQVMAAGINSFESKLREGMFERQIPGVERRLNPAWEVVLALLQGSWPASSKLSTTARCYSRAELFARAGSLGHCALGARRRVQLDLAPRAADVQVLGGTHASSSPACHMYRPIRSHCIWVRTIVVRPAPRGT